MQKINRWLALVLCLVMLVSSVPLEAFATGDVDTENTVEQGTTATEPEATQETNPVDTNPSDNTDPAEPEPTGDVTKEPEATEETEPEEEPTDAVDAQSIPEDSVVSVTDPEGNVSGYTSLQAALDGAFGQGNGTYAGGKWMITLLGDTSYATDNIGYPKDGESVNLTIDLNGHTIQGVSTDTVLTINFGNTTPGTLTIQDSVGTGKITGGKQGVNFMGKDSVLNFNGGTITGNHGGNKGGGIYSQDKTTLNLNGGVITGNSVTASSSWNPGLGGGVCANKVNVNGTVITGNAANGSGSYPGRGGGLAIEIHGTTGYNVVSINANTIYGNTATDAGDDLMIAKNGQVKHTLVIGTENWYIDGWNGVSSSKGQTDRYSTENPVPYTDGGFTDQTKINLGLKYVVNTVSYTVTYTDGVEDEAIFEDQTYTVKKDDPTPAFEGTIIRKGYVFDGWDPEVAETVTDDAIYTATWTVCNHETWKDGEYNAENGTVESVCTVCGETKSVEVVAQVKGTGVYYETLQEAINAADNDTVLILKDLDVGTVISVKNTVTVTAENAVTLTRTGTNDVFDVYADATLTLEGPVTLVGNTQYGTMVDVLKSGTFVMNDGVTIKDNKTGKGNVAGGVTVTDGTFIMNGGVIENCSNTGNIAPSKSAAGSVGGGVRIRATKNSTVAASFTMNGGTIRNCSNRVGGGIGLENMGSKVPSTVVIKNGLITGCTSTGSSTSGGIATGGGSAIYIWNNSSNLENATVTMYGGTISGNKSNQCGALSVCVNTTTKLGGKFYILGGTIKDNSNNTGEPSSFYGNGIYLARLVGGQPLLTVGGSAVIDSDIYLGTSGNYIEIQDGFTGYMKVYVVAGGTGKDAEKYYGTLVAKQTSGTATKEIAGKIIAIYPFKNDAGQIYEHPSYDVVLSKSAADEYVLGEHPDTFTVTYTDGVEDAVIFEDQTYTVESGDPTPAFEGVITRKGYVFDGWNPTVADTVTENVTYTALWKECTHSWDDGTFNEETCVWMYTCTVCGETKEIAAVARLESTGEYFTTLQEAVDAADTYSKTLTENHDQTVTLVGDTTECVKIVYTPNKNNLYHYTLTIDLNGHTVTGNGTGSVFTMTRYTSYAFNLTVVFNDSVGTGKVTGGNTTTNGGAVYVSGKTSYLVINGGTWTGNHADKNGGAISSSGLTNCPVTINGGVFTGNTAGANGGAFYIRDLTMTGGTVTGNSAAQGGGLYSFSGYSQILNMTGGKIYGNTATTAGDDIIWRANNGNSSTAYLTLVDAGRMGAEGVNGWYYDNADARYDADTATEFADYAKYTTQKTLICLKAAMDAAPAVPEKWGDNVMEPLVKTVCDSDPDHVSVTSDWSNVNCQVFPTASTPVWDGEIGAWTIGIRIQQLTVQYVAKLEKANNKITHELVGESLMLATLKWDKTQQLWVTLDGEPLEVHATCQTKPAAPVFGQLSSYQIQVYGQVGFETKLYAINLNQDSVTVGEVKGSRKDGFTVDVTVAIAEDDAYQSGWLAKRAPQQTLADYTYDWAKTPKTITFTLKYTGDLNGTLYGNRNYSGHYDWVLSTTGKHFGKVGEAYLMPAEPSKPTQDNVTDELVKIICDSDPDRHGSVYGKWYPTCCKTVSGIVWSDEMNAWIVDVRIGSLYIMYVDQLESANYNVEHTLVDENLKTVYATLMWDVTTQQWVPSESIELHTTCRTAPLAPIYSQINGYQIKVKGDKDVNGVYGEQGETWTTSIPENGYTLSEVRGSREDGFYVDVTVELADGDLYQTRWIEKCDKDHFYKYNWDKTEKTVTFTLRYTGSLTGTLYGNRNAANTNYDWVLDTTGKTSGVVSEAFVDKVMCTVQIQIYRNGDTTKPYKTVALDKVAKGDTLDLTSLDISDYYSSTYGFEFEGWFNDGRWNQYKAGQSVTGMDEIAINGWTNIICMVTDNQRVVVKSVLNGNKDTAETVYTGVAPLGTNVIEWLNENVEISEKAGYTSSAWYNWDWFGHKVSDSATINGWTNVYINYTANTYTVSFNTNGGEKADSVTVTFGEKYGKLPNSSITGLSSRKNDWYLVDEDGIVTEINIRNTTVVSVARDHELFLMRDVLAPTLSIKLTVPGGLSDDYKYYIPGDSTRVLTVTVNNRNDDILDYTYQWYKGDVPVDGATDAVLKLDGNVSDSGTYKVVVTATLKEDANIVAKTASASGEKTQDVKIMYAANTLRMNANFGENPETQDNYWGSDKATVRGTVTRTGYTLTGWNTAADGSGTMYQNGDELEFPGANGNGGIVLELFAQWKANTYKVTLDANGGKLTEDTLNVTYGEAVGKLPTPTREGYVFCGWVDADGNKVTAETVCDWTEDVQWKATWAVVKPVDPTSPGTGDGTTLFFLTALLTSACALILLVDRKRRMQA